MLPFTRKPERKSAPLRKQAGTQEVKKGVVMVVMILPPAKKNAWFILNKHPPWTMKIWNLYKPSFLRFQLFILWACWPWPVVGHGINWWKVNWWFVLIWWSTYTIHPSQAYYINMLVQGGYPPRTWLNIWLGCVGMNGNRPDLPSAANTTTWRVFQPCYITNNHSIRPFEHVHVFTYCVKRVAFPASHVNFSPMRISQLELTLRENKPSTT